MLWLLLALPIPTLAGIEKTRGVPPSLLSRYQPPSSISAPWTCLDGSKTIAWSAVNDDYCDCLDGSDEPGTGACPNSVFYCINEGHIGSSIPSTRVGDGLCEPECCDGSDESSGLCPNICKEAGEVYQKQQEAERKLRRTGSKIRQLYISYAQKERKRLEGQISTTEQEIVVREKEVARLKDMADTVESISEAGMTHKKQSPLYQTLMSHHYALKSLQCEHKKHLEREKALGDILDALRLGYNPNYQDMAVLEAVRGWEALAGLPHINDVRKEEGSADAPGAVAQQEAEQLEEGMWSAEKLEENLEDLLHADYETLLLEHDKHIGGSLSGQSLSFRHTLVSWLETFGIAKGIKGEGSSDTSTSRKAYNDAESKLSSVKSELEKSRNELERLSDPEYYGAQGEWKKLDGTCLTKDTGEYTYEVCLFGEAKQKPNKGGSFQSLGKFSHWNNAPGIEPGSPQFYSKQYYERGSKCWNGPMRSVTLLMSCGTENAILSVAEPEKCEYQLTATSPALCLPLDEETHREEL